MTDLLPCPFCGSAPDSHLWRVDASMWTIECIDPDCPAHPLVAGRNEAEAIELWNRRAPPDVLYVPPVDAEPDKSYCHECGLPGGFSFPLPGLACTHPRCRRIYPPVDAAAGAE